MLFQASTTLGLDCNNKLKACEVAWTSSGLIFTNGPIPLSLCRIWHANCAHRRTSVQRQSKRPFNDSIFVLDIDDPRHCCNSCTCSFNCSNRVSLLRTWITPELLMGKATTALRISKDLLKGRRLSSPVEIFHPKSSTTSSAVFHAELVSSPDSICQKSSKKLVTTSSNNLARIVRKARAARLKANTELMEPNGSAIASKK